MAKAEWEVRYASWVSASFRSTSLTGKDYTGSVDLSLVKFPWFERLKFDGEEVQRKVGMKLASKMRKRMKSGQQIGGKSLPRTKSGDRAVLNDTGELIRSIKYDKKSKVIFPKGYHSSSRREYGQNYRSTVKSRNAGILAVQVFTLDVDPLGVDSSDAALMEALAAKEIQRQIDSGKFSLVHEIRRVA